MRQLPKRLPAAPALAFVARVSTTTPRAQQALEIQ